MRYRRAISPGGTYFFTVNLQDRKSHLLIEEIQNLRVSIKRTLTLYPFFIDGVVILPDHLHMIMTLPPNDSNYSLRWNLIKGTFSKNISPNEPVSNARKNKSERGIWQRRFWEHLIKGDRDFEHHLNYIHYNPVKHGYVNNPSDWPFSSIHRYIRNGMLSKNWGCSDVFGTKQFGE